MWNYDYLTIMILYIIMNVICLLSIDGSRARVLFTWSETYFWQDLFPAYLFFRRQFHAIVIFRLKSISDLDFGSLPRFFGEFI